MDDANIISRLNELISMGQSLSESLSSVSSTEYSLSSYQSINRKCFEKAAMWRGSCLNLLKLKFGENSDYYQDFFRRINEHFKNSGEFYRENVSKATGVLGYILGALESGLTEDLFYQREIFLFSDLLKQAYEFLEKNFKEAAAIYGRIVLELTIKELASKNGIDENTFEQSIIKLRQQGIIHQPLETSLRANYQFGSLATHMNEEFKKRPDSEITEYLNFIRDRVLTLK